MPIRIQRQRNFLLIVTAATLLLVVQAHGAVDLRQLIATAVEQHDAEVVIPPGVYRMAPVSGSGVVISVVNARNLKIVADGVTMICTKRVRAISFSHCQDVTLQGLTIDYDPLPFTQGDVIAVAPDKGWIDVKIHDGYPCEANARIDVVDPQTRYRKRGMPFLWGTKSRMQAPDVVRVTLQGLGKTAAVGDLVSLSRAEDGGAGHTIAVERCARMTLRDVTLFSGVAMGIIEAEGDGGSKFIRCRIIPGPPPPGATQPRLLSSTFDAMQSRMTRVGPLVEDCTIRDAGDDSWSVQSDNYLVVAAKDREAVLDYSDSWIEGIQAGDRIQQSLDSPAAVVTAREFIKEDTAGIEPEVLAKIHSAAAWSVWKRAGKYLRVTLDRDVSLKPGDTVFCPDRQGNGFVFRNNHVRSAGRILVEAGGVIENNTLDTIYSIVVHPDHGGAAGIQHLTIRGNSILNTGYFCPAPWSSQAGALSISAGADRGVLRPETIIDDVLIENNTFRGISGVNLVIASARNVTVAGNRFEQTHQGSPPDTGAEQHIDQSAVVYVAASRDIKFRDNIIAGTGPFMQRIVRVGPATSELVGVESGFSNK